MKFEFSDVASEPFCYTLLGRKTSLSPESFDSISSVVRPRNAVHRAGKQAIVRQMCRVFMVSVPFVRDAQACGAECGQAGAL